uniref:SIN3-HDAC complex associated factor n=1 Tax=Poecilia reticulata TaxID=8081 RepID=A0A3P9PS88_POERE
MFGFHKPKMYRSLDGCCICRAKSSSSRFTDSKRYEKDFRSCFGLSETRSGEICNACVLLVKRWKKLPVGTKKNWNHVVDARGGPSLKITSRPKKIKTITKKARPSQISRLQKELKRNNSDAHSTTSSASPAQSPSYSNLSDDGSDTELSPGSSRSPVFSFLDLTYWKRQKVCCGIIYKGRFGEVLIDPHLFKPCCRNKQRQHCLRLPSVKKAAKTSLVFSMIMLEDCSLLWLNCNLWTSMFFLYFILFLIFFVVFDIFNHADDGPSSVVLLIYF